MKAYVTSIGEPTTRLCVWSLERNGFEVTLFDSRHTSLAQKLNAIYVNADDDFVRVDADVIPNRNLTSDSLNASPNHKWWIQYQTYDWFKQDLAWGGIQFVKKDALPYLRDNVGRFMEVDRPETQLSRIDEFFKPRRFESIPCVMGIHNFKQDSERVKATKISRGQIQNYDFELALKIEAL